MKNDVFDTTSMWTAQVQCLSLIICTENCSLVLLFFLIIPYFITKKARKCIRALIEDWKHIPQTAAMFSVQWMVMCFPVCTITSDVYFAVVINTNKYALGCLPCLALRWCPVRNLFSVEEEMRCELFTDKWGAFTHKTSGTYVRGLIRNKVNRGGIYNKSSALVLSEDL